MNESGAREAGDERPAKRSRGCLIIAAVIGTLLVIGAAMIVEGIWTSVEAEKNLHAVLTVAGALESYVSQTGRWPRSWDELASVRPVMKMHGFYDFPEDLPEFKSRVAVRFDAPEEALRHPRDAGLIRPIGPYYGYEFRLDLLYETLERTFDEKPDAKQRQAGMAADRETAR